MRLIKFFKIIFLKLISKRKKRSIPLSKSPKFLLLMHQNIGDMIVFSALIREIKVAYPNSKLQVLASINNKEIAEQNPYIDNVILYQNKWNKLFPSLIDLKSSKFDFAVELEAKVVTKVILMLRIINPSCILSVTKREGRYGLKSREVLPYDYYTDEKLNHQRDTSLDILRLINVKVKNKSYDFFYSEKYKNKAKSFFSKIDNKKIIIALNITGSSQKRRFLDRDSKKILRELRTISQHLIIILLHKPKDLEIISQLIDNKTSEYVIPSYPTESILDVAALIHNVDLVITPDTSLVHMACALEIPLVAVYSNNPESFAAWHPKSEYSHVIFSKNFDSLDNINVDSIIEKSADLIKNHVKNFDLV